MWKRRATVVLLVLMSFMMWGCRQIKLTTGLKASEYARIGKETVSADKAYLLLSEQKYAYESVFDTNVWTEPVNDVTAEEYVKNSVKDTIRHVYTLVLMADDMDVVLTEEEDKKAKEAAKAYFDTLDKDKNYQFTENTVYEYYKALRLAEKVFYGATDGIDTEVSEDEARVINVQYIFFSTGTLDEDGSITVMDDAGKNKVLKKAENVAGLLEEGSDFISLVKSYSDDTEYSLEFGRGEYDKAFEDGAFALETGEISPVIEAKDGFYIIKCTNDNVESDYEQRSSEIILSRRIEAFADYYEEFISDTTFEYNDKFSSKNPVDSMETGNGSLYEIYRMHFVSTQFS